MAGASAAALVMEVVPLKMVLPEFDSVPPERLTFVSKRSVPSVSTTERMPPLRVKVPPSMVAMPAGMSVPRMPPSTKPLSTSWVPPAMVQAATESKVVLW